MAKKISKKKKKSEDVFELCKGVTLVNEPEITRKKLGESGHSFKKLTGRTDSHGILSKSVLEVMVVWGSMVGFLTSIECAYNVVLVLVAYIFLALFFAGLFRSGKTWVRDLWYIAFFAVFVVFILVFKRYINSGFYAVVNEFLDHVTDYYGAADVKVFSEAIENRAVTIPIAAIAIGTVQIIILNIFLNNSMSVLWAVGFTLPVYIAPLFFGFEPDVLPMLVGIAGLIGVICLKGNRHFKITDSDNTFEHRGKQRRLIYRHSDRASLQLVAEVMAVTVLIFVVITIVKPVKRYMYKYTDSSLKKKIEAPLGNLIMYGFESLRNTANTGGLARGRLGAVSDVRTDGETDLVVRFAPYSTDRVYLRGFVGEEYSWDHWSRAKEVRYKNPDLEGAKAVGVMNIRNIDGMNDMIYYPYYTSYDETLGEAMNDLPSNGKSTVSGYDESTHTLEVSYVPYLQSEPREDEVDEKYLSIPDVNIPVLAAFCDSAGIKEDDNLDLRIQKVYEYFVRNYPYTLHPGATPKNEDYVNYFLQTTKKGLCANYATAGALILRYMGVPARYVEGYVIDYSDVGEAELLEEEKFRYDDYFKGESELGRTAVVQVDVTDEAAHAWIEAFIDGRWQIVEFTPPSNEDEDENVQDFWTRLGKWLAGDDEDTEFTGNGDASPFTLSRYRWVFYILVAVIAIVIGGWGIMMAVRKILRISRWHRKIYIHNNINRYNLCENIVAYYRYMCDYARMAQEEFKSAGSHIKQLELLMVGESQEKILAMDALIETVLYSNGELDDDTAVGVSDERLLDVPAELKEAMKRYKRTVPFVTRMYLFIKL